MENKVYESFADMVWGVNSSSERAKKSNQICLALILIFCVFYKKYMEGYFFVGILVLWGIVLWFFYKDICDGYTRYYVRTVGEEELVYNLRYHSFDKKSYYHCSCCMAFTCDCRCCSRECFRGRKGRDRRQRIHYIICTRGNYHEAP